VSHATMSVRKHMYTVYCTSQTQTLNANDDTMMM